jgi:hypothetical protein
MQALRMAPQSCAAAGAVAKITMEAVARKNVRMRPLEFSQDHGAGIKVLSFAGLLSIVGAI